MDMTIRIEEDKIVTTLFEKPSNFHLYIPPQLLPTTGIIKRRHLRDDEPNTHSVFGSRR
jgi:hypothetical protein